ncbi:TPA: DUF3561 family protein [Yersinia enterocolitica]|uniref:DUF3561 family protein n=1 Tax=Yersinia enterocolitica TaxID=630 RepID=UPI00094B80C7|nr:DUF3561 family protein [Yersinia enterocolitica]MBW5834591.1 DUF3561 family protein [Yersinia enterocolitica]MBX9475487.1 DUF3561 family protein [Yersinia enterocolitica]MBX9488777.1 DUF3561 family protein [Yersinia enterocolitica]MBX9492973.1 DUF3561 family protein [Yersinia enterocolitica]HDL8055765.1 DUF3561 family protein [Yersinia enterocolitica]
MLNITQITIDEQREREEPSYSFLGGVTGFVFYWLAFAIPFFVYGSNTVFFLLYTWPFFLALMPVSVLIGITLNMLSRGNVLITVGGAGIAVVCLFWMLFSFLTGW